MGRNNVYFAVALAYLGIPISLCALLLGCLNDNQQSDDLTRDDVSETTQSFPIGRTYIKLSESADYRLDFEEAIESGDMRFIGIMGYALEVPDVPDYHEVYADIYGVKVIEGTSDSHTDDASFARQLIYKDYAKGYNSLLLEHLRSDEK